MGYRVGSLVLLISTSLLSLCKIPRPGDAKAIARRLISQPVFTTTVGFRPDPKVLQVELWE